MATGKLEPRGRWPLELSEKKRQNPPKKSAVPAAGALKLDEVGRKDMKSTPG